MPAACRGKSLWIDFDGVYRDSKVWLNGHYLGHRASGYTGFRYDIAPYVVYGGQNALAVHVDPRHFEGWWYEGGGIYRHVWLNVADPVHVAPWATFVSTPETFVASVIPEPKTAVRSEFARLAIKTTIANTTKTDAAVAILFQVLDAEGRGVTSANFASPVVVAAGKDLDISSPAVVENPKLWSPATPYLYRLVTTIKRDSRQIDTESTRFGIRTIHFDPDRGFFLNGKPVKIQGTCNHQDFVGVGIGVPDKLQHLARAAASADGRECLADVAQSTDARPPGRLRRAGHVRHGRESTRGRLRAEPGRSRQHGPPRPQPSQRHHLVDVQRGMEYAGHSARARIFKKMMDTVHLHDATRPISWRRAT